MQKHSQARFSFLAVIPLVILLTACGGAVSQGGFNDPSGGSGNSLAITTSSLPAGQTQTAYQTTLAASGGTTPYSWQVVSGQLPPGLTLNATTGEISGTPSTTGQFNFTAEVTDSSQPSPQTATRTLMIDITASSGPAVTVSPSVASVQIGLSQQFTATVTGTTNTTVDWLVENVQGGNATVGTISTAGLYTAPAVVPNPSSVTVTARSVADSTATSSASVGIFTGSLDQFGGCTNCGVTGQATGFFHVEKINGRWWFIDPSGNPFWMKSVQNIDDAFYPGSTKYPNGKAEWASHVNRRLKHWGFTTPGEYASLWVVNDTVVPMPYLGFLRPSEHAMRNVANCTPEPIKEIVNNIPTSTFGGFRGQIIDAYDPDFVTYATCDVDREFSFLALGDRSNDPWLIGWSIEDGDQWFGVSGGDMSGFGTAKPHAGWLVLVSQDPTNSTWNGPYGALTYADTTNYSKLGLRDFLKTLYSNDINALNAAWGSSYTSWDHAGGYGVGSGLLDEWGGHTWVCSSLPCPDADWRDLAGMSAQGKTDLDAFLKEFTRKLVSVGVNALRTKDTNHMVFSPDAVNGWGFVSRRPVLEALAEWVDVINVSYNRWDLGNLPQRLSSLKDTYDITGKPMFVWTGHGANPDSAMSAQPNLWFDNNLQTQAARAQEYSDIVDDLLAAQGTNGDFPMIGLDWWGWGDMPNEQYNWGLVTILDNAYDGQAAVTAVGVDQWGYATGGESGDYGDFLNPVRTVNRNIFCRLTSAPCPP